MIRRFYVHNFRCLDNFELPISGRSSTLLIGNNGSGKSTVALALGVLQSIGRGINVIADLIRPSDFSSGQDLPMRFEIEVELKKGLFQYIIAFEIPRATGDLRLREERLSLDGEPVYSRDFAAAGKGLIKGFQVSWQLIALPVVDFGIEGDAITIFRRWLARLLILRPIPSLISGDSSGVTLEPRSDGSDFGGWFAGLLQEVPAAYNKIEEQLKRVMPDFHDIRNSRDGRDVRGLAMQFSSDTGTVLIPFRDLSDGEKCFAICSVVLAMNQFLGPVVCFWDESDNYLAVSEVGHFVMDLRRCFEAGGQFIATSHNPEAILTFSDENTLVVFRRSHLEPTQLRPLSEIKFSGDLATALVRGYIEP